MTSQKSGISFEYSDKNVRPQDDLYRFMNGTYLATHEIPADRASDGAFNTLRIKAEKEVFDIIEELSKVNQPEGSTAKKIGDLYTSFMDEERIEKLALSPIASDIKTVLGIKTREEFIDHMGEFETRGNGGLFYFVVYGDAQDSTTNIGYTGQSGLSLPDEAYYREAEYEPIRAAFLLHMQNMFNIAGIEDPNGHSARVLALETELASHHWDQVKCRDAVLTYNKKNFAELQDLSKGFDWIRYLKAAKTPESVVQNVVVSQPSFFTGLGQMMEKFEVEKWRSWLLWHLLSGSAPYLHKALVDENFEFYGKTLSGIPQIRERWKRGVSIVEGVLGEAIGEIYVSKHFPPDAKKRMDELVANLIEAYRISINNLDWMSDATKAKALAKLEKFTPKIGYPVKWRDYSALQISPTDLIGNIAATTKFTMDIELEKIGKPVDKDEWLMTPQTVNAYYMPLNNEIVFPAAILQWPFFDLEADDAANYGAIGVVIGHEIGHGFDDQGSKYDGDGNLNDWWTDFDREEFDKRTKKLIEQFNELSPEGITDAKVNGALTIGENIGDLGGLTIAYKAYEIALKGQPAPIIDGLSGYERFFYSFAQSWCGKTREEEMRRRLQVDPHSPPEFRVNQIVKNFDAFYEVFNVQPGDKHYLAPGDRVSIW